MEEMTSLQKLEKAISEKDYISAKSYVVPLSKRGSNRIAVTT